MFGSSILAGELPASTKLPPIRPSGDARRVSPNTVSSAYKRLEAEGLVFANHNGKRFVAPDAAVAADVASAARALIQESLRDGVGLDHTVLLIRGLWPAPEPQVDRDRETAPTTEPSEDSRRTLAEQPTQAPTLPSMAAPPTMKRRSHVLRTQPLSRSAARHQPRSTARRRRSRHRGPNGATTTTGRRHRWMSRMRFLLISTRALKMTHGISKASVRLLVLHEQTKVSSSNL
ncbi:GntR family transcriptional regulator [Cryobacterium sp. M91]|uniref:GntR family transcriptional regulator n=1 Tax=Cryobacterium sp. M91 TaxID=2048294 RepID=UPI0011B0E09B